MRKIKKYDEYEGNVTSRRKPDLIIKNNVDDGWGNVKVWYVGNKTIVHSKDSGGYGAPPLQIEGVVKDKEELLSYAKGLAGTGEDGDIFDSVSEEKIKVPSNAIKSSDKSYQMSYFKKDGKYYAVNDWEQVMEFKRNEIPKDVLKRLDIQQAKRGTTIKNNKMAESTTKKRFDSMYKATKPGMRKSKKFAKIEMKDGSSFRRRNANQFGDADGGRAYTENRRNRTDRNVYLQEGGNLSSQEMGTGVEMAKRGTTLKKRSALAKAITKDLVGMQKSDNNRRLDSQLKATKAGKRKSKKYARIQRKDGSYFRRRNANQFGEAEGNKSYYEYRKNRTDKNVWLEQGGELPTMSGFTYQIGGLL